MPLIHLHSNQQRSITSASTFIDLPLSCPSLSAITPFMLTLPKPWSDYGYLGKPHQALILHHPFLPSGRWLPFNLLVRLTINHNFYFYLALLRIVLISIVTILNCFLYVLIHILKCLHGVWLVLISHCTAHRDYISSKRKRCLNN